MNVASGVLSELMSAKMDISKDCFEMFTNITVHPPYSWNIMCQKWEGDCGLWVLNEIILKRYAESLKKIVGAVWELPAK